MVVDFGVHCLELGVEPLHGDAVGLGLLNIHCLPSLDKAEGVPYLVVEVAALLAEALVEEYVIAGRS